MGDFLGDCSGLPRIHLDLYGGTNNMVLQRVVSYLKQRTIEVSRILIFHQIYNRKILCPENGRFSVGMM